MNQKREFSVIGRLPRMAAMILCLPLLVMAWTPPASAQQVPSETGNVLEEVVVTAQKRKENLETVPISVVALTGAQLENSGISTSADLPTVIPGLNVTQAAGYFEPHLRGIGTSADAASVENPIALYIDGVYYGHQAGSIASLINTQQVEVDYGPQGTLFGRNATGGLIQITTWEPKANPSGEVSVGYGNYDTVTTSAYLTGAVASNVAADLTLYDQDQSHGYGTNFYNGEPANKFRNSMARSKWLFTPSDGTRVTVIFDYEQEAGTPTLKAYPGELPIGGYVFTKPQDADVAASFYDSNKQGGASVKVEQTFGIGEFSSITAYRQSEYVVAFPNTSPNSADITIPLLYDKYWQASQEFQLASHDSSYVKWVTGVFFFTADSGWKPLEIYGPALDPLAIFISDDQRVNSGAAYGQATFPVATATNLTLGARYTVDSHDWHALESFTGIPIPSVGDQASLTDKKATWRISLDHTLSDTVLIYASDNRGFKSGGFNDSVVPALEYQPETLDAYETGLKTTLLDSRMTLNTALFYYDYKNIQVTRFIDGNENVYNGSTATIYGVDLSLNARVTDKLQLRGGAEWLHGRYGQFPQADYTVPAPGGGDIFSTRNADGKQIAYSPTWTAFIAGDYTLPAPTGQFHLNTTFYYNSGWFPNPDNRLHQDAYTLINASFTWVSSSDKYRASLWGKNLGNTNYAVLSSEQGNGDFIEYAPPLTFGVTFTMKFGNGI